MALEAQIPGTGLPTNRGAGVGQKKDPNLDPHSGDAQIEKSAKEFYAEGVNARAYSLSIPLKESKGGDQVSD